MAEKSSNKPSKIQQVLDIVTQLNIQMELLIQRVTTIENAHSKHEATFERVFSRLESVEKNQVKHQAEHDTEDKEKSSNFRWADVVLAALMILIMVIEIGG